MKTLFFLLTFISPFFLCSEEVHIACSSPIEITRQDVISVYEDFSYVEQLLVGLAIQKGDEKWEAKIKSSLDELSTIEKSENPDVDLWFEKNYAFHLAIVEGCNSSSLIELRNELYLKLKQFTAECKSFSEMQFKTAKDPLIFNNEEHVAISKAIFVRDEIKAKELVHAHILGHCDEMLELLHL